MKILLQKNTIILVFLIITSPFNTLKAENFFAQNASLIKGGLLYISGIVTGIIIHKKWSNSQKPKISYKERSIHDDKKDLSLPLGSEKTKRESIHLSKGKVTGSLIKALFHDAEHSQDTQFLETVQKLPEHMRSQFKQNMIDEFYNLRAKYKTASDRYHNRTGELYTIISNLK